MSERVIVKVEVFLPAFHHAGYTRLLAKGNVDGGLDERSDLPCHRRLWLRRRPLDPASIQKKRNKVRSTGQPVQRTGEVRQ